MTIIKDKSVIIFIILAFFLMSIPRVCAQNAQGTQTVSMSAGEAAIARQKMVDYSKKYVGSPYVLGATGPESFDCSGFVFSVSRESIGVQLPRTTKAIYKFCKDIDDSSREAGDLVFFKTTSSGEVSHVGIYMGNSQFIHCVSDGPNTGVIVSSLKESYWKSKYFCTKRYLPSSNSELLADSSKPQDFKSNDFKSNDFKSNDSGFYNSEKKTSSAGSSSSPQNSSSRNRASSSSSKIAGSGFLQKLVADASVNLDWNFFTPDYFRLTWRGLDAMAHVCYEGKDFRPGAGVYIHYDAGTENLQIPFVFSLTLSDYVRAFAGPVFSIGKPVLPGNSDEKIKNSFFPGILGICWNTPSIKAGKTEISFVQDIHYTVFNKTDSSALSPRKSIPSGLVFATGVRVTLPLKNLL